MRLLVHMRDGRTVFRIIGRGVLAQLCRAEPWHEEKGVYADRGTWNPATGEYVWTTKIRLRQIAKASISFVEEEVAA